MVFFAPAKINLGLNILAKRDDGYHEIQSVFYPTPWEDAIEMVEKEGNKDSFESFNIPIDGSDDDNLCIKAVKLLRQDHKLPFFDIRLIKNIPIGAGLGGGSSDASSVLMHLNKTYELGLTQKELAEKAAILGSDCPFFIYQQACLVEGRGERISPIDFSLKSKHIAVIYPDLHISTKAAYQGIIPMAQEQDLFNEAGSGLLQQDMGSWTKHLKNDFQSGLYERHAVLRETHEQLAAAGARYVAMSGSGSSVFGIFDDEPKINSPYTLFQSRL
jgi:4-diphosphocytidyl-2-C-methyl-D-erythritol kinase